MPFRRAFLGLLVLPMFGGCFGYRFIRPEEIEVPSYEPRPVVVPEVCTTLIDRAAQRGMGALTEQEGRMALFCQQQQIIRAQEEETALRRIEAHAEAASFALRVVTLALGATFAVLTWIF